MERTHLFKLLAIVVLLILAPMQVWAYSGGTGEPNDPYQIATAEDLMELRSNVWDYDASFILTADLDLDPNLSGRNSNYDFKGAVIAPALNADPRFDAYFEGSFDGQGHTIVNLTINGEDCLGLFGRVTEGAVLKNLILEAVDIQGTEHVGALVGRNLGGIILSCSSSAWVEGYTNVGGLVGIQKGGEISNCSTIGSVSGDENVGGLVGRNYSDGLITSSFSTSEVQGGDYTGGLVGYNGPDGDVTASFTAGAATLSGDYAVGGLVGINAGGQIRSSYSTGVFSCRSAYYIGGLVGWNLNGGVTECYFCGSVYGKRFVGGLVGINGADDWIDTEYALIQSCYTIGSVAADEDYTGSFVGMNGGDVTHCYSVASAYCLKEGSACRFAGDNFNIITSCFWDKEVAGVDPSEGRDSKNEGTGLATTDMQDPNTYLAAGWDFVGESDNGTADLWHMQPGGHSDLQCLR